MGLGYWCPGGGRTEEPRMRGTWQTTDSGGGGVALIVIIAALAIGSGAASAAVSALEVIAIVIACLAAAAALGGIALIVYRARSERRRRPIAARPVYQVGPESRPQLEESHKPATPEIRNGITQFQAIEPPQLHLHF